MISSAPALLLALLFVLSSCVGNHKETVGFRVSLMPPCHIVSQPRNTIQESSSVTLELHASGSPTINGDDGQGRPWVALLREIFSTRFYKTLLLVPDQEVQMEQILTVLDQLQKDPFLNKIILLTPQQVNDSRNEFCVVDDRFRSRPLSDLPGAIAERASGTAFPISAREQVVSLVPFPV